MLEIEGITGRDNQIIREGVAAVYQRHEFLEERKTALEAWGRYVQSLTDGTERDNVVKLHDG